LTSTAWALLAAAALFALADWWGVATARRRVVWVAKPAATALVLGVAAALMPEHEAMRGWFVAGFALCLAGDVLLMLPRERFVAGLASFLLGHLAFIVGFASGGLEHGWALVPAALLVAGVVAWQGPPILRGAGALAGPVVAYLVVISAMLLVAWWYGRPWGMAGASLFVASDTVLGRRAFVDGGDARGSAVAVMVTYHLALTGLVLVLPA